MYVFTYSQYELLSFSGQAEKTLNRAIRLIVRKIFLTHISAFSHFCVDMLAVRNA